MRGALVTPSGAVQQLNATAGVLLQRCITAFVLWFLATTGAGFAQERGTAAATGSDSLTINGQTYLLFGIDGLEFNQSCFADGRDWACGVSAVRALQTLLDPAPVTCTPKSEDRSGASLAGCTGPDGDIALRLVEQGWALARPTESPDYVAAETAARDAQLGAWRGTFLKPQDYRARLAAIESRYAELAAASARNEAESSITSGLDLGGLVGTEVVIAEGDRVQFEEQGLRFDAFSPGFINGAIHPPEVFDWSKVASVLEGMRLKGVEAIEANVTSAVWSELAKRPARTVDTRNEGDFYAALLANSAAWIAAGRQPVVFVMAFDLPNWVRKWFAGQAPAGAELSRRVDRGQGYLGTIDGIDVHLGPGRERAALLVPADVLVSVAYRRHADGHVVDLAVKDGNEWVLRYGLALEWQADPVVWLTFPQGSSPTPDAE